MNKLLISILTLAVLSVNVNAGNIAQGKIKSLACAGCHGPEGISLEDEYPNLAGQKATYLIKQLKAFKNGIRIDATMNAMTQSLSEQDMEDLASYFSQLSGNVTIHASAAEFQSLDSLTGEFPESVFISMKGSALVKEFPTQKISNGGPNMLYTAISPNNKLLLSTSPSTNTVYVFDATNMRQIAIIPVGSAPKGVKVTPNGKFAYVSNQGSADISVIDLSSLKNVDRIKVAKGPHNVRFTKNGALAYVTLQGGSGIGVIDTVNRKIIKIIPTPGITGPHNIDLSPDENTAYVRDFVNNVAVVNLVNEQVIKVIKVGNGHGGIDVDPKGRFIVTAAIGDEVISVIDPKTFTIKNIKVGKGSHGVRASKNGQWIYVTITGENKVVVINTSTMQIEKSIGVEKFPFWIAVQGNP